ncbi:hypothetical protein A1O1_06292 [Capronia coronata CBS 617.96]|uniref:Zn(2)-C6 fungal-type domain-containing protein n=1 Tax=Capronia coronata CBS 617.96 TaxID=1182541 RepID=W9Y0D5_9EURO|nr:uncharacterized protein A1O1_06292 [Capronia coronata CBS 617.96]EXJ85923.1 hypothetical protein A1O1_06292 [Capronia coronata CBS 617.96]
MGRRPNPLVAEYFERGSKIGDASNRYAHTCKKCGEHFAKGRLEGLTTHLTKKCPSISHLERTRIVMRMHDLTDLGLEPSKNTSRGGPQEDLVSPASQKTSQEVQNFNGLNVLAEASRRVGGNAQNNSGYTPANQAHAEVEPPRMPLDPQLDAEQFADHLLNEDGMGASNNAFPTATASGLPAEYSFVHSGAPVTQDELTIMPVASTHPPDLSSIAATANETLASQMVDNDINMTQDEVSNAILNSLQDHSLVQGQSQLMWPTIMPGTQSADTPNTVEQPINPFLQPPAATGARMLLPAIPLNANTDARPTHFVAESGTPAKSQKPKVRGRFDEERRKEVRELRKLGACMRCRMLKKVCSQETPCQTCSAVESPRVWKHSCVRTKLADSFPLYSVLPYGVFAHNELSKLKAWSALENLDARLLAWYLPEQKLQIKAQKSKVKRNKAAESPASANGQDVFVINTDDQLSVKVEQFLQEIRVPLVNRERSEVIRATLTLAQAMQDDQLRNRPTEKNDNLLPDVIELWTATVLLTDRDIGPHFMLEDNTTHEILTIDGEHYQHTRTIMTLQLQSTVEKRASKLGRAVMNHLEQRVLERKRYQNVETVLVAFILLNCAERMCWLYRLWAEDRETTKPGAWPLHHPAGDYASKGEGFAEVIRLLLSLRQMEPVVTVDPGSGFVIPRDPKDTALAMWLSNVGLTRDWLVQSEAAIFDPADSRSTEGALCARLFQT